MKKEQLFKSIADIKEEDVKKARQYRAKRKAVWIRWAAAAACAVIAVTAIVSIPLLKKDDTDLLSSLYRHGCGISKADRSKLKRTGVYGGGCALELVGVLQTAGRRI